MNDKDIIIMYIQDDEADARIEYEPYHIWLNGNYIGCDFAKKYGFSKSDGKKPMNFIRKEKPKIDFSNECEIIELDSATLLSISNFLKYDIGTYFAAQDSIEDKLKKHKNLTNTELNLLLLCYYHNWEKYVGFVKERFGGKNGIKR